MEVLNRSRKSSRTGGDRKQILYLFMKVVTGNFHFTTFDYHILVFSKKSVAGKERFRLYR